MANLSGFDAEQVEPNEFPPPFPEGWYECVIIASEEKPTKAGGEMLSLKLQVIEGEFKGRKFNDNLNLKNASAETVEIAKGTLSSICRAVGVLRPNNSEELHNLPLMVNVVIKGEFNNAKGYRKVGGPSATPAAPATKPTAAASTGKPWERK